MRLTSSVEDQIRGNLLKHLKVTFKPPEDTLKDFFNKITDLALIQYLGEKIATRLMRLAKEKEAVFHYSQSILVICGSVALPLNWDDGFRFCPQRGTADITEHPELGSIFEKLTTYHRVVENTCLNLTWLFREANTTTEIIKMCPELKPFLPSKSPKKEATTPAIMKIATEIAEVLNDIRPADSTGSEGVESGAVSAKDVTCPDS